MSGVLDRERKKERGRGEREEGWYMARAPLCRSSALASPIFRGGMDGVDWEIVETREMGDGRLWMGWMDGIL